MKFIFGIIKSPFFLIYKLLRWIGKTAISFISLVKNIIVKTCKKINMLFSKERIGDSSSNIEILSEVISDKGDEQSPLRIMIEDFISTITAGSIYYSIVSIAMFLAFLCKTIYGFFKKDRA